MRADRRAANQATADLDEGFRGIHWALLIGSVSRKPGMERKDLLAINGKIFTGQGRALQKNASPDVRILVVGNPCNTNCLIAMQSAPEIPRERWFAMTRLDENRAKAQLAKSRSRHQRRFQSRRLGQSQPDHVPRFLSRQINGQPVASAFRTRTG